MVYHIGSIMPRSRFSQTIYVRKKYKDKRKWIPIGYMRRNGEIVLEINPAEISFLVDSSDYISATQHKAASKWFEVSKYWLDR